MDALAQGIATSGVASELFRPAAFGAHASQSLPHADHDHDHSHPHVAILFFIVALSLGALTTHLLTRWMPKLPYTITLLVEGFAVGVVDHACHHNLGSFSESLRMWSSMDPHLLLFAFLPALLFADSMGLSWHLWKRRFGQCILLAGPGVIVGNLLTAAVGVYVFPYGWTWNEGMMFGSILAATDPVAVVALLKELGAPAELTMTISGEALLNDGVAIVLFKMFQALALGTPESLRDVGADPEGGVGPWVVTKYFCWMSFGGAVFGAFVGLVAVSWIGNAKRRTIHSDGLIQIAVTLCCAYFSFFVGEHLLGVSGVIATVAAALVVAACGWPHFVCRDSLGDVWHTIEYIGNTLIFFLAGVIIGDSLGVDYKLNSHLELGDLGWLLVLYGSLILIRAVMVVLLFPFLSRIGGGFTWRDGTVLTWGGLRGAVGLSLALEVAIEFKKKSQKLNSPRDFELGSHVLFHVGGIAMMTVLVNGITSAPLLRCLGMTKTDKYQRVMHNAIDKRVHDHCLNVFEKEVKALALTDDQLETVRSTLHVLKPGDFVRFISWGHDDKISHAGTENTRIALQPQARRSASTPGSFSSSFLQRFNPRQGNAVREIFLEMLRCKYLDFVDRGILNRHGQVTVILNESIDISMTMVHAGLRDWQAVLQQCTKRTEWKRIVDFATRTFPRWLLVEDLFVNAGLTITTHTVCYMLVCFVQAHKQTQVSLRELFRDESEAAEREKIVRESEKEVSLAQEVLANMDEAIVSEVKVEQLVNIVLESERAFITKLQEEGALQEKEAHHLLHHVDEAIQNGRTTRRKEAHNLLQQEMSVQASAAPAV